MDIKKLTKKKRNKMGVFSIIVVVVLSLYALSMIAPMIWAVITSFKDFQNDYSFNENIIGFPKPFYFKNYKTVFENFDTKVRHLDKTVTYVGFGRMVLYSILYSVGCGFFSTFIPFVVGYAMGRYKFRFSGILYGLIIVTMALPIVGNLASEVNMARTLQIYDTFPGIWLMSASFGGTYTLVFYASFKSIPAGYTEAAEIDGASQLRIMFSVIFPLAIKVFMAVFLLKFIQRWNEYETALVYLPTHPTIAYGLWAFNEGTTPELSAAGIPGKLAACMVLLMPVLILFIIFQDKLMGNVSMGGLKG